MDFYDKQLYEMYFDERLSVDKITQISITLDELLKRIEEFELKYGEY